MSGLSCPHCGEAIELFGSGGGERTAAEMGVDFLGRIPMDPRMVACGDSGSSFQSTYPDAPAARAYAEIAARTARSNGQPGIALKYSAAGSILLSRLNKEAAQKGRSPCQKGDRLMHTAPPVSAGGLNCCPRSAAAQHEGEIARLAYLGIARNRARTSRFRPHGGTRSPSRPTRAQRPRC